MNKILSGSLLIFLIMSQMACKSEPKENFDSIYGKWELETATNNGKPTELLTGLFFEFSEDGAMRTNVTGTIESVNFTIAEGIITQREGRFDIDYEIKTLNDTLLTMATKIRNSAFQFSLSKVAPGEDE